MVCVHTDRVYEISVRSMNIDDRRPTTDLRANSHILQKFQIAANFQLSMSVKEL